MDAFILSMKRQYLASVLLVVLGVSVAPATALAQWNNPKDLQTGIELSGHLGFGTLLNGGAFPLAGTPTLATLRGSVGGQFHFGYRFLPPFSAGLHFMLQHYASTLASASPPVDASGFGGSMGLYFRVYPLSFLRSAPWDLIRRFSPYVGVGFDFVTGGSEYTTRPVFPGIESREVSVMGVSVPFSFGMDFYVHRNVAVGLLTLISPVIPHTGCSRIQSVSFCDTRARMSDTIFYIGVGVTGHFHILN